MSVGSPVVDLAHNDVDHLKELLAAEVPERPKLIVFEALYSMDGDVAPVSPVCGLQSVMAPHSSRSEPTRSTGGRWILLAPGDQQRCGCRRTASSSLQATAIRWTA